SKPQRETRRRVHRVRAARPTTRPGQPQQFNFFEMLFGGQQYQKPGYGPQRYQQPGYNAQQAGQQYHQPAYGYGPQQYQQYQPYASPEASQQSAFSQVPRTTPY
ncbi:MAG: hypothetical protein WCA05_07780, partial [Pseudolabrys sp.]